MPIVAVVVEEDTDRVPLEAFFVDVGVVEAATAALLESLKVTKYIFRNKFIIFS